MLYVRDVAARVGVSHVTIRKWVAAGLLPPYLQNLTRTTGSGWRSTGEYRDHIISRAIEIHRVHSRIIPPWGEWIVHRKRARELLRIGLEREPEWNGFLIEHATNDLADREPDSPPVGKSVTFSR